MSRRLLSIMRRALYLVCLYGTTVNATPIITFPINSQVPPVARVQVPFSFTFSLSTFSSHLSMTYTLSSAPIWLFLDGPSRTLSGIAPMSAADTAPIIQITASDDSGSVTMNTTLVISNNPAPMVVIPLEDQLKALGTYSPPSSILYYPSTTFDFSFDPGTFGESSLNHYAVTMDNAPLPSWITFDGAIMSFSGRTPNSSSLVQPPQTWGLQLIASDILGFSGVAVMFNIVVGNHKLEFKDGFLNLNATVGMGLYFTGLSGSLDLDGGTTNLSEITSIDAHTPDWLFFDNSTFALSGIPPADAISNNVSVTVTDVYGDVASAMVHVHVVRSIFRGLIESLNATIGTQFSHNLRSFFVNDTDVVIAVYAKPPTPWLVLDSQTFILSGSVPSDIQPSVVHVTLQASSRSSNKYDSEDFTLNLISPPSTQTSTSMIYTSTITGTAISTAASTNMVQEQNVPPKALGRGSIAAIVVCLILTAALALFLYFCCYRRRRRLKGRGEGTPNKSEISNPKMTSGQTETELGAPDRIVQVEDTLSPRKPAKALKRYSHSMSSLGGGVSMYLRDSYSSGARGRSYSENAMSNIGSSWRYTQDSPYPPLPVKSIQKSATGTTRNFSRKTNMPLSELDRSSGDVEGSTVSQAVSKVSKFSIEQTPKVAYNSENIKQKKLSRRHIANYLGIPDVSRRLSGLGHGSRSSVSESIIGENWRTWGFGHGASFQGQGSQSQGLSKDGESWLTIPESVETKEQYRYSTLSALTESTDVLNSPKKMTMRMVPNSPGQPAAAGLSRVGSRRAIGSSPFFASSSRTGSRGTYKKPAKSLRDKYLYVSSPSAKTGDLPISGLEKTILQELRDFEPASPDLSGSSEIPSTDPLGINYGSPQEGTRQLKSYVSQMSSLSIRNSFQFSDGDSRFRSAEASPRSQHYEEFHNQGDHHLRYSHYGLTPGSDQSPSSFNRDRYGLDESPQLAEAIGAQTVARPALRSPLMNLLKPEIPSPQTENKRERHTPSPGRPASSYSHAMVREKSFTARRYERGYDEEADISFDGGHGAFL